MSEFIATAYNSYPIRCWYTTFGFTCWWDQFLCKLRLMVKFADCDKFDVCLEPGSRWNVNELVFV